MLSFWFDKSLSHSPVNWLWLRAESKKDAVACSKIRLQVSNLLISPRKRATAETVSTFTLERRKRELQKLASGAHGRWYDGHVWNTHLIQWHGRDSWRPFAFSRARMACAVFLFCFDCHDWSQGKTNCKLKAKPSQASPVPCVHVRSQLVT